MWYNNLYAKQKTLEGGITTDRKKTYLLPTIFALVFSIIAVVTVVIATVSGRGLSSEGINEIRLVFPDGTERTYSSDDRRERAYLLSDLVTTAEKSDADFSSLSLPTYRVTYTYTDRTDTYNLFAADTGDGYHVYLSASDGSLMRSSDTAGQAFLSSELGEDAFQDAALPVLYTSAEDAVTPSGGNWYFLGAASDFRERENFTTDQTGETTYYQNGYVGFRFSIEPDTVRIVILDEDKTLFDGTPEELATSDLSYSGQLHVRISADWNRKDGVGYYGHTDYDFRLRYVAPAVFTPSAATAPQGGFLLIRCENILDADKIKSQMLTDASLGIRFFRYGTDTYGVVTVSSDSKAGNKTVRCSYGGVTTDITFTVTETVSSPQIIAYLVPDDRQSLGSASARQGFITRFRSVSDADPGYLFLSESFVAPFDGNGTDTVRFGDTVAPDGMTDTYTAWYTEFGVSAGTAVFAMNGGVIMDTGYDPFFGNYIVIGHGSGVQTWYGHLSSVSVRQGDVVSRGEMIGIAGDTGFASGNSLVLAASVCGRLVDPELLLEQVKSMIHRNY